jgi:hypothetical protein
MLWFAKPLVRYFPREAVEYPQLAEYCRAHAGDGHSEWRHLNLVNRSADMMFKTEGLWGYEVVLLRRHAEFMAFSQNFAPDAGNEDMPQFHQNSHLFQLLRGRYALLPARTGVSVIDLQPDPLPRFLVVPNVRVLADRDEILRTLAAPDFDFRREVILETPPGFANSPSAPVTNPAVKVLSSSAKHWEIEVTVSKPGVLLMTDSYAKGWRATALTGSAQSSYHLQPADWAVRGIPLTVAGKHRLEIKYTPHGFAAGAAVSSLTVLTLCAAAFWRCRRHQNKKLRQPGGRSTS